MLPSDVDVLIVGAGPTGLTAACALHQAGRRVLLVDQEATASHTSRAAVVHARTLEALHDLRVTDQLLGEGLVVPVFTIRDRSRVLARIDFAGLPTAHPYTLMLPQSRTEALLTQRLEALGAAVHRGVRLQALTCADDDADGSATAVLDLPRGDRHTVRAQYVIGADGLHSTVRSAAGIAFPGGRYEQSFALADVHLRWPLPAAEVQLFTSSAGLVVVAPLPGGRHRVVATTATAAPTTTASSAPLAQLTATEVQQLLDQRGPAGTRVEHLVWGSRFRVHHRLAETYRAGHLLLAGDAAHVHSPAGGQGMNTGIQDALDLAATLDAALAEEDAATRSHLLDGYGRRRRPVAARVVTFTDRTTRMATLRNPAARLLRNTALSTLAHVPPVRRRIALQLAGLAPCPGTPDRPGPG